MPTRRLPLTPSEEHTRGLFDVRGACAVVTGGSGTLGRVIAQELAARGAQVAVLGRNKARAERIADAIQTSGGESMSVSADVLVEDQLRQACATIMGRWERIDILVNGAGGNISGAVLPPEASFLDLDLEAVEAVVDLNLLGALRSIRVFAEPMVAARRGSIINISSMAAGRALSRVGGYGAAKAGLENLTRWLAVHVAQRHSPAIRVNAIAPGFILAAQNRDLLFELDGGPTDRGRVIVAHTPMGRLGQPEDLVGTVLWLASGASSFVTGAVIPVDGGFSAFGGV